MEALRRQLAAQGVDEVVTQTIVNSKWARSTSASYDGIWRQYMKWCDGQSGVPPRASMSCGACRTMGAWASAPTCHWTLRPRSAATARATSKRCHGARCHLRLTLLWCRGATFHLINISACPI